MTEKLILQITDAGDGIHCDHFVFGEARVLLLTDDPNPDTDEITDKDPDNIHFKHCIPDTEIEIGGINGEDLGIDPKGKLTTMWAAIKGK